MQTWLPAGDALMGMFVSKLPSPVVAQKYRVRGFGGRVVAASFRRPSFHARVWAVLEGLLFLTAMM